MGILHPQVQAGELSLGLKINNTHLFVSRSVSQGQSSNPSSRLRTGEGNCVEGPGFGQGQSEPSQGLHLKEGASKILGCLQDNPWDIFRLINA